MADEVVLKVGGRELGGWKEVAVTQSIESIANGFTLSQSELEVDDPRARRIQRGERCTVTVAGERIVRGFVQRVAPGYDEAGHSIAVKGWDATRDLVKSSITVALTLPAKLEDLIAQLVAPHAITVDVEVDTGAPFKRFKTQPGEPVFAAIKRAASFRGVLLVSDGDAGLVVTLPGLESAGAVLQKGINIKRASAVFDDADRFSEVTIKAQQEAFWGGDSGGGALEGKAVDGGIDRFLPLVEIQSDVADGQEELDAAAQRTVNLAAAQALRVSYGVEGWRTQVDEGALWKPGELVSVDDSFLGIRRALLLTAATFSVGGQTGRRTQLNLMRPEAFDLRVIEPPAAADGVELWDVV
ncbi:MAG: hypothetical protein V3S03_08405 [Vicinamibacteria bacterium]